MSVAESVTLQRNRLNRALRHTTEHGSKCITIQNNVKFLLDKSRSSLCFSPLPNEHDPGHYGRSSQLFDLGYQRSVPQLDPLSFIYCSPPVTTPLDLATKGEGLWRGNCLALWSVVPSPHRHPQIYHRLRCYEPLWLAKQLVYPLGSWLQKARA